MTTLQAEIALMSHFDIRKNIIVPCVSDWSNMLMFETDLLVLSKSGYATGIEIKVTKADLKSDLRKKHIKHYGTDKNVLFSNYSNTKDHYYKPFKYFYYAVPENLKELALEQIPNDFGLITMSRPKEHPEYIYREHPEWIHIVRIVREPKVLHKVAWSDKQIFNLLRVGTMRIYNLKRTIEKLKN